MKMIKPNKKIKLLIASIIAIAVWQFVSMKIDQTIVLSSPVQVAKRMVLLFGEETFVTVLFFSFSKIILGFLTGVGLGTILAVMAGKWENFEILLKPFMSTIKAVPVASFVVLSLLWFGSENLSTFIAFLMVLPIIYTNVLQGIKSLDVKMVHMAKVFRFTFGRKLKYLWLPAIKPFIISGSAVASGLAWKSGVAAEIIGIPDGSIGEVLFESKVYLDTETLLAWTAVIVALSIGTEKIFSLALKGIFSICFMSSYPQKTRMINENYEEVTLKLENVCKSFGGEKVIENFSAEFSTGVTVLLGASGSGKTTLLNMIMGLEKQDGGTIEGVPEKISAVFQEDRLSEDFTPMGNVKAVTGDMVEGKTIVSLLSKMGLDERDVLKKKTRALSGGMKRRVAICRALCAQSGLLILDEPFKGLDGNTKENVMKVVKKYTENKTVIFVTHDESEAEKMQAVQIIRI